MYNEAIAVLKQKKQSMERVCGTYAFSECTQKVKTEYIQKLNEIDDVINYLEGKS